MPKKNFKRIVGLMSGTSLDGLDMVFVEFWGGFHTPEHCFIHGQTIPYPEDWQKKLANAPNLTAPHLLILNLEYGQYLGQMVIDFLNTNHLPKPDLIASHGHTVFHEPNKGLTYQMGSGRAIAHITGITTIADFRTQDVLLGGQGAPLVPIGDELLYGNYSACLNLGGFANISFNMGGNRVAYDLCPVNILLNHLSEKIGQDFDENGNLARRGSVNHELLETLNNLDFYQQLPPKSLAREWLISEVLPHFSSSGCSIIDQLRTAVEHSAYNIAQDLTKYKLNHVLATGGGAKNAYLMEKIQSKTSSKITIPETQTIDFKESIIFGLLGWLRFFGQKNVLKSATGSSVNHSAGEVFCP